MEYIIYAYVGANSIGIHSTHRDWGNTKVLKDFCFRNLTTFQFNPRTKRYKPDKQYYKYEDDWFLIPVGFLDKLDKFLAKEGRTLKVIRKEAIEAREVTIEMNPEFKDKDHQVKYINKLSTTKDPRNCLELQTGKGKTYCATKVASRVGKATMVVADGLANQWYKSMTKQTMNEDIYVVQGHKAFVKLVESDDLPSVIIWSLGTLRKLVDDNPKYTKYINYREFLVKYGIGFRVVDEAHQNLHACVMADLVTNVSRNLFLSATFDTNARLKRIFETIYPLSMRIGGEDYDRYVNVFFYTFYGFVPEKVCLTAQGYSHNYYEQYCLDHEDQYIDFMTAVLVPIIKEHYVKTVADQGYKLLIFVARVENIKFYVEFLRAIFPDLDSRSYTSADPEENLEEADIIVSTHGSCGTGNDVPMLARVINTVSFKAKYNTRQFLGRLRFIPGIGLEYIDLADLNLNSHVRHKLKRVDTLKQCCSKYVERRVN